MPSSSPTLRTATKESQVQLCLSALIVTDSSWIVTRLVVSFLCLSALIVTDSSWIVTRLVVSFETGASNPEVTMIVP